MPRNSIRTFINKYSRKVHRWGAIGIAVPMIVVIATGILLQVKKQSDWIQPPTSKGIGGDPQLTFDQILEIAMTVPEIEVAHWDDVDRLDVRPGKGILKVRAANGWESQIDLVTGEVVQTMRRRSDLIESIHDGSWFHDSAKLWVFLPNGCILLVLWITGLYLWVLPISAKRSGRRRRARNASDTQPAPADSE